MFWKNSKAKFLIEVIALAIFFVVCVVFFRDWKYGGQRAEDEVVSLMDGVYFEGEVVNTYTNKNSSLLCVRVDTATVDSLYRYEREYAIFIKKGLAVLPIGLTDVNNSKDMFKLHAQRVVVNKENDMLVHFINGQDTLSERLNLWPGKLEAIHILIAWEDNL